MTSYFDDAEREVHSIDKTVSNEDYLKLVAAVEERVVRDVLLNTGDREFPDDLRERILNLIATRGVYTLTGIGPTERAVDYALTSRSSELLSDLHSAFHRLATRRVGCRWGHWTDNPRGNLSRREDHDKAHFGALLGDS